MSVNLHMKCKITRGFHLGENTAYDILGNFIPLRNLLPRSSYS